MSIYSAIDIIYLSISKIVFKGSYRGLTQLPPIVRRPELSSPGIRTRIRTGFGMSYAPRTNTWSCKIWSCVT